MDEISLPYQTFSFVITKPFSTVRHLFETVVFKEPFS